MDTLSPFLAACPIIDFHHPALQRLASDLKAETTQATARKCFHHVRDKIRHSSDYRLNPVTCSASDVLTQGTGYCYAKSHLLVALLRANQIPAGLCYQRLSVDGTGAPFCLHGLAAIYLPEICPESWPESTPERSWYRIDPRGNRPSSTDSAGDAVDAQFTPPLEQLAFPIQLPGEFDLPGVYPTPLPKVVDALRQHLTWDALLVNLPDLTEKPPTPIGD